LLYNNFREEAEKLDGVDNKMHKGLAKAYKISVDNRISHLCSSYFLLLFQSPSLQTQEGRADLPHLLHQYLSNHLSDVYRHSGGLFGQNRLPD